MTSLLPFPASASAKWRQQYHLQRGVTCGGCAHIRTFEVLSRFQRLNHKAWKEIRSNLARQGQVSQSGDAWPNRSQVFAACDTSNCSSSFPSGVFSPTVTRLKNPLLSGQNREGA